MLQAAKEACRLTPVKVKDGWLNLSGLDTQARSRIDRLGLEQKRAFATSVAVILPLSAVSLVIYFFRGGVDFLYALPFLLGGLAGGVISGRIFKKMPVTLLRRAFGLLILYGGIRAVLLL